MNKRKHVNRFFKKILAIHIKIYLYYNNTLFFLLSKP